MLSFPLTGQWNWGAGPNIIDILISLHALWHPLYTTLTYSHHWLEKRDSAVMGLSVLGLFVPQRRTRTDKTAQQRGNAFSQRSLLFVCADNKKSFLDNTQAALYRAMSWTLVDAFALGKEMEILSGGRVKGHPGWLKGHSTGLIRPRRGEGLVYTLRSTCSWPFTPYAVFITGSLLLASHF